MVYAFAATSAVTSVPLSASWASLYPAAGARVQVLDCVCSTGEVQERLPFPAGALAVMAKLWGTNFAVAVAFAAGFRLQVVATPLHAPLHPARESPGSAIAVRVRRFPVPNCAAAELQAGPQLIATGLLTTVPRPVPVASFWTVI